MTTRWCRCSFSLIHDEDDKVPAEVVDMVERLHAAVDEMVRPLAEQHASRLSCRRGCADCCVDELRVFEVEAAVIRRHHAPLLSEGQPRAPGGCAFLDDEGSCRIYAHRPYVCRTQGLPLRWLDVEREGEPDEEIVERRDICRLNVEGPPLEQLAGDACWTIGPVENKLGDLQAAAGNRLARVRLRDLFSGPEPQSDDLSPSSGERSSA